MTDLTPAGASALDAADPLAGFRGAFVHDDADPDLIYLDGNSLGRLPVASATMAEDLVRQWGHRLIRVWNEGWFEIAQRIGDRLAELVGAEPGEVVLADSTSIALYKTATAALQARPG
ncbi:MAG: hypothetical protein QGI28_08750, partial [Acidimicrobiales bacterium]|nr:hypothetical protein [Acidimicrobiales bacterium]